DAIISNAYSTVVQVPADQTYTITVNDQCGYEGSADVTTFIPHPAPFRLTLPPEQVLCAGDSLEMHSMVTGGSNYYHILWAGEDSITDPLYWVRPDENTTYSVWVKDQCGEELTDSVTIEVEHVFTSIVVTNHGEDDWQFNAATLPYAINWIWDMGDGTRYRHDECFHSYTDLEDHWVTLKIVTPNGCEGIDSVFIEAPAHIYFPNCFTPDGDTNNETFGPKGNAIEEFEMRVFDRWGEEVYHTTDIDKPWDGKVNGSDPANTGVYVYTYRAAGHYFQPQEGVGHVTLLRGSQQ
ncbi:MAG TPA: gliding motility-associated C-terminal domain-containing protein, partial [Flavobacteriales bacterium]|nr:gliding motility-associated C-terminal domain-containing protein [Flavobacteriales bacterium]